MTHTCRPNFYKLAHEYEAEKAYLRIMPNGSIETGSYDHKRGYPVSVFNREVLEYWIDSGLTQDEIDELIALLKPHIDRLIADSEMVHRNNWKRVLGEVAQSCDEYIEHFCLETFTEVAGDCGDELCNYCAQDRDYSEQDCKEEEEA